MLGGVSLETYNWSFELFGKSLVKYIQRTKHTVQPTSYDSYMKYGIKIAEYFDMYCIHTNELTPEMIEDYYNYIREKSPVTENTVRHYHVLIYKFCRWLYKRGYRIDNPADKIDKPKAEKYKAHYYSEEDAKKLIYCVKNKYPQYLTAILLALQFGLRRSEVCALKFSDIDFTTNTLTVNGKIVKTKGNERGKPIYIYSLKLKSSSSNRTLPFGENFSNYLKSLITKDTQPDDFVFTIGCKSFVKPDRLTYNFKNILKQCNLPQIRFHDLRHSCASILINNDISMKIVQEWLGHSSFATTANLYGHVYYKSKLRCLDTLEKSIF